MRPIDADALKDSLCFQCDRSETGYTVEECRKNGCGFMSMIDNQPTFAPERSGRECFIPCRECSNKYCYYRREENEYDDAN